MEKRTRLQSQEPVERWEYLTQFVYADFSLPGVQEFIRATWPGWQPAMYSPQAMMPVLNELGADGWELVHMQPVAQVGANEDVKFTGDTSYWSHAYFCVFKRRV